MTDTRVQTFVHPVSVIRQSSNDTMSSSYPQTLTQTYLVQCSNESAPSNVIYFDNRGDYHFLKQYGCDQPIPVDVHQSAQQFCDWKQSKNITETMNTDKQSYQCSVNQGDEFIPCSSVNMKSCPN